MNVLAVLPTIPNRQHSETVIENLVRQGADVRVFLNGFETVPDGWPQANVVYNLSHTKRGPLVRYSVVAKGYDFVFFVDDDIVYPEDYIETTCRHLSVLGRGHAVGWHVSWWNNNNASFTDRGGLHCTGRCPRYLQVAYVGSGALALWADDFALLEAPVLDSCYEFEDDVWVSSRLAGKGIKLVRPPSNLDWIQLARPLPENTLWEIARADGFKRRESTVQQALEEVPAWRLNTRVWYLPPA